MKVFLKILKAAGFVMVILVLLVSITLGVFTAAEYRPAETKRSSLTIPWNLSWKPENP